jgi:flagellar hook-length control protein FliK
VTVVHPPAAAPPRDATSLEAAPPLFQLPPTLAAAAVAPPTPTVRLATQPPQLAHDVGLAIARQVAAAGNTLHIRLEPAELGRIDVSMRFDDAGTLRAVVGADSTIALDLLRRDSAELGRALGDAGVRADSQSFRFEGRSDGRSTDSRGQDPGQQRPAPQRLATSADDPVSDTPDPTRFRPLRWRGQVDVTA